MMKKTIVLRTSAVVFDAEARKRRCSSGLTMFPWLSGAGLSGHPSRTSFNIQLSCYYYSLIIAWML